MNESHQCRVEYLLQRYASRSANADELQELIVILQQGMYDEEVKVMLEVMAIETHEPHLYNSSQLDDIFKNILKKSEGEDNVHMQQKQGKVRKMGWRKIAVAACVVGLLLSTGYWLLVRQSSGGRPENRVAILPDDVAPPKSANAVITLATGRQIILDSTGNGTLANQGAVNIVKLADGQIVYKASSSTGGVGLEEAYNMLTNPRGSKVVSLTLADGTKVWLNSESSLRYPTAFAGNERKVEVTGEAYFEVSHNEAMPFKVTKGDAVVTVLGTQFNVNAYPDEMHLKVTLLEGSVKVSTANGRELLKPGEQAQLDNGAIKVVPNVDMQEVMAWKNGFFYFNRASLEDVLRQVTRWYDVDIAYEGKIHPRKFVGEMQRNLNLSQVLKILEKNRVHFRIEGKKIVVMP